MATYEHATSIGAWYFKALVESSKLRQMTFNEEAAHRNKPNCRHESETRWTAGAPEYYQETDTGFMLILQGVHAIADEAAASPDVIHAYIPYPQGAGLTPFLRRPIPVVGAMRMVYEPFPATPSLANLSYHNLSFGAMVDAHSTASFEAMPEASVGVIGIDATTDFKTSLVISHRWSNNKSGDPVGDVHQGGYLFWRVIGHIAAY